MRDLALLLLFFIFLFVPAGLKAQDLMDELNSLGSESTANKPEEVIATFKGYRIINGHSTKTPDAGEMIMIISHRFGTVDDGFYGLYGLDRAGIRLGLEYSPIKNVCIGFGRSRYQATYDFFVKPTLMRQKKSGTPITLVWFSSVAIEGDKTPQGTKRDFVHRLEYVHQALIARKFNEWFSLQLMPTFIQKNRVQMKTENNYLLALGFGTRFKLSRRVALVGEFYPHLPDDKVARTPSGQKPIAPLSLGFDIETGGHVFQLHFTNAQAMFEQGFIMETNNKWHKGEIAFGFNITRTFSIH